LTQTRGAWLGVVLGCALLCGLSRPRYLLALPLLLGLAAGTIHLFGSEAIRTRVASLTDLGDRTLENRLYLWRAGLGMVRANPVLGVGIERTDEVYDDYMLPGDIWYEDYSKPPGQLNNNFIHIAAERGLVGLAAWLSIWVAFFAQVWRAWRRCGQEDGWSRAVVAGSAAALVAFLGQGVFEYNYNDSEVVTVVFVLMALPLGVGRIQAQRAGS